MKKHIILYYTYIVQKNTWMRLRVEGQLTSILLQVERFSSREQIAELDKTESMERHHIEKRSVKKVSEGASRDWS